MSALERDEFWRFRCPKCLVETITKFPVGYRGRQVFRCPGCEQLAEVVERPKVAPPVAQVVDMFTRRSAQLIGEQLAELGKDEKS